jgi:hypothetical protein
MWEIGELQAFQSRFKAVNMCGWLRFAVRRKTVLDLRKIYWEGG